MSWLLLLLGSIVNDPETSRLIGQLDSECFRVRQGATARLADLPGWRSRPVLARTLNRHPDPEVRMRCQWVLDGFYAQCGPTEGPLPSVYCLAGPPIARRDSVAWEAQCPQPNEVYAFICHVYYSRVLRRAGYDLWLWNVELERQATWLLVEDLRAIGISRTDCRQLMDWMQKRSNPEPYSMRRPPFWLQTWAVGIEEQW